MEAHGRDLSKYVIEREVGRGTSGVVYYAHDKDNGSDVALKLLHPNSTPGQQLSEAELLIGLHHPGIVRIFDYGVTEDAQPFSKVGADSAAACRDV